MKASEMKSIRYGRENLVGFLHISDIIKINDLFDGQYDVKEASFFGICDAAIALYNNKSVSKKDVSAIFEILKLQNTSFRIESHRYEVGSIFEYSVEYKAYFFSHKGNYRDFNALNKLL